MLRGTSGLLILLLSLPVFAGPFAGRDLVIPIVGRTGGAFGSDWKTDVVVTNLDDTATSLSLIFSVEDTSFLRLLEIQPGQTMLFEDIVKTRFGVDQALGWLRVSTPHEGARLTAHARIHNTNATRGESSQIAQAIPVSMSGRDVVLSGLTGLDSHRTNVGFGTTEGSLEATLTLRAADGTALAQQTASVGEEGIAQINNIFAWFGVAPFEGASVQLTAAKPLFAYASTVRNDTGDGYLLTGASRDLAVNDIVTPACSDPALLLLAVHPAQGYIVLFEDGTDTEARVAELEQKYGFQARFVFSVIDAFSVEYLPAQTVAALRCESDVRQVEENARGELSARTGVGR